MTDWRALYEETCDRYDDIMDQLANITVLEPGDPRRVQLEAERVACYSVLEQILDILEETDPAYVHDLMYYYDNDPIVTHVGTFTIELDPTDYGDDH